MLVVKVELWPNGNAKQARELGRAEIGNVGGDLISGVYQARFKGESQPSTVERLVHLRDRGFWWLVMAVLESAFYRDGAKDERKKT